MPKPSVAQTSLDFAEVHHAPVNFPLAHNPMQDIKKLEEKLWAAADNLRANSKLTSSEYCMPVLGVIFLRHATNRYEAARAALEAEQAAGKFPKRPLKREDFVARRSLMLPEEARYGTLVALGRSEDLGQAVNKAMAAIERDFPALDGQLPKDFEKFEPTVLEDLLRIFDGDEVRRAGGDVFGRIYEYFLQEFAIQGAQDNGEFFTPPSIVQMIVNVIEPDHGTVLDPACGSGGMFVQSSHFIEEHGKSTSGSVTFYGQEKTPTTIRLAKMNLAVHGLEGKILEANTFYEDKHELYGRCDFVMANPPFNVDLVDADKVKTDCRLPFGLPGVNKAKKVGNANYLWISFFHSYLNERGRAGFVMSSQASSAGNDEAKVRRKLVETGDVDVMISIRSNFFYTRTVPCELWFFDRGKPRARKDFVLMIDARNVYRKVTRKIYDFAPEQLLNLSAIVWLYRGQKERFLGLVQQYLRRVCTESEAVPAKLDEFNHTLGLLEAQLVDLSRLAKGAKHLSAAQRQPLDEALSEVRDAMTPYADASKRLLAELGGYRKKYGTTLPSDNKAQHAARTTFEPLAEQIKAVIKQVEHLHKLISQSIQLGNELASNEALSKQYERRTAARRLRQLEEEHKAAIEQLKQVVYFYRQVAWLQERFPDAVLCAVPGLCKVVERVDIESADWSLTPGRYVGVAPAEVDEDFDFQQAMQDIHTEITDLNKEAEVLALKIQKNFERLLCL